MSEIFGIGTDLVAMARIEDMYARFGQKFAKRILSDKELVKLDELKEPVPYLAKRFAGKEAISKALGTGIGQHVSFQDMAILNQDKGQPFVDFSPNGQAFIQQSKISHVHISLSDENDYALAFAVACI